MSKWRLRELDLSWKALFAVALLVGAGPASPRLTDRDFQQLMEAAAAASTAPSQVQPLTTTVCVQEQLEPPLTDLRAFMGWFQNPNPSRSPSGNAQTDASIAAAMSLKLIAAGQTNISTLPPKFVLVGNEPRPDCLISRSIGRGPNWKHDESVVRLTFTRPALAKGYAFIQEYEDCPGLCGTTFLRVFKKRNGKWTQAARIVLSVS